MFKGLWHEFMTRTLLLSIILVVSASLGLGVGLGLLGADTSSSPRLPPLAPTPQRLHIPTLQVQAAIEQVGLDQAGNMDVPQDTNNVAWYRFGPAPGQAGNSVIAGHLDSKEGPAIFYRLGELAAGDEVIVSNSRGHLHRFRVTQVARYPFDQFPLHDVFGPTDKYRLNLITCEGVFDRGTKNYSHRIVVYTELIT